MAAAATSSSTTVRVGTRFQRAYRDSNATWEVTNKVGRGVWEATIVDNEDWAGATDVFRTRDILEAIRWVAAVKTTISTSDEWWASREIGSVAHYHDAFGQYARGVIALKADGSKGLQVTGLVGSWRQPIIRLGPDGKVAYSTATHLLDNDVWAPHMSNVWEASESLQAQHPGIDTAEALDVSVPEATAEEARYHALFNASRAAGALTAYQHSTADEQAAAMREALDILTAALAKED